MIWKEQERKAHCAEAPERRTSFTGACVLKRRREVAEKKLNLFMHNAYATAYIMRYDGCYLSLSLLAQTLRRRRGYISIWAFLSLSLLSLSSTRRES